MATGGLLVCELSPNTSDSGSCCLKQQQEGSRNRAGILMSILGPIRLLIMDTTIPAAQKPLTFSLGKGCKSTVLGSVE